MKKTILLLSAGLITSLAHGQEALNSLLYMQETPNGLTSVSPNANAIPTLQPFENVIPQMPKTGAKTTAGTPARWYNFAYLADTLIGGGTNYGTTSAYMWYTDGAKFPYGATPTYSANNNVSIGTIFDPTASGFDASPYFPSGIMAVNNILPYTIDTIQFAGYYHRNPTNSTTVDTIRMVYTQGTKGGTTSNIAGFKTWGFSSTYSGHDTIPFLTLYFDSTKDKAAQVTGGTTPVYTQDILLHQTDTSASLLYFTVPLTTTLNVLAGNVVGVSLTFRSGDPLATATFNDTVWRYPANTYKYGEFRPLFTYNNFGGTLHWPEVIYTEPIGWNMGLSQIEPASRGTGQNRYFASLELNSSGNPIQNQNPWISFHVVCPTCPLTGSAALGVANVLEPGSIKVYPNPANNTLMVNFASTGNTDITLTNMLGQVVATQQSATGATVFNTSNIPAGIYVITLSAEGQHVTSRVVIAH